MFSFQGAVWIFFLKRLNEVPISLVLQSISLVESTGIEPVTSCLQGRRSPSWANPPNRRSLIVSSLLPIESPAKRVSIGEEKPICKGAFRFQRNAEFAKRASTKWWAKMDSNHRPHDYQSCALASWAIGPYQLHFLSRYIFPCTL